MKFSSFILSAVCILACQVAAMAVPCPSGYPNEIFCDDFDTYCSTGGYPGATHCVDGVRKHDPSLRRVWSRTSTNEYNGNECGSEFTGEEDENQFAAIALWYNPGSTAPLAARYPMQDDPRGQMSFRDWVLSPLPPDTPGQIYNFSRLVKNVFGSDFDSVIGTDDAPLNMEFFIGGGTSGAIDISGGYIELAMDGPSGSAYQRRANTDFAWSEDCRVQCLPDPIQMGPFPILCAQGNPGEPGSGKVPDACPPIGSAPVRKAIAIGTMEMLDTNPCHCGVTRHGPQNAHLVVFDGRQWWTLRHDDPRLPGPVSGEVVNFKNNQPATPPDDIGPAGSFDLAGGENYNAIRSYNWIKVSVRSTTFTVELKTLQRSKVVNDPRYYEDKPQYYVTSRITLPRYYEGPFNTVRFGVGPGCPLQSNTEWDTCVPNDLGSYRTRRCLDPNTASAHLTLDSFLLHGGAGYSEKGACCEGASCSIKTLPECQAAGGRFRGPSTACVPGACAGACCFGPVCTDVAAAEECTGMFQGLGTACVTSNCSCTSGGVLWADSDADGDVDIDDFGKFQACFTGGQPTIPDGCRCMDHVPGNGIDTADYDAFVACVTRSNVPTDLANLPPGCTP